jgi:hypothetical protein
MVVMGDDLSWIVSCLPNSDKVERDNDIIDAIIKFLILLSNNLYPPGYGTSGPINRSTKILNRIKYVGIFNTLFRLFKNYSKQNHRNFLASIIGNFYHSQELPSKMRVIIDLLKEQIEEYTKKNIGFTDDIIIYLNSLRRISINDTNIEYMLRLELHSLLLDTIKTDNLKIVQYSVILLGNLGIIFTSENTQKLVESGLFDIFLNLFKHFTFVTSTEHHIYASLFSALQVLRNTVNKYSPSPDLLIKHELMKYIVNVLPIVSSLSIYDPLLEQIKWILRFINSILYKCGKTLLNVKKLFEINGIELLLKSFETISIERGKERIEFDEILYEMSRSFTTFGAVGFDAPTTTDDLNGFFFSFEKINTTGIFCDIFAILKPLNFPSKELKNCLYNIVLFIFYLYCGQTPPVCCGLILSYGFELKNQFSPSEGIGDPTYLREIWGLMIDADEVVNKWKKGFR